MTLTEARLALLRETLGAGSRTKSRLAELLDVLSPKLPFSSASPEGLDRLGLLETDSLLLQFSNMVATVQDQLVRNILFLAEEPVQGRSRRDQREMATKLGALPSDLDFEAIVDARNSVAHQYPNDLARQAEVINAVAEAAPLAIRAFDSLADYARRFGALPEI